MTWRSTAGLVVVLVVLVLTLRWGVGPGGRPAIPPGTPLLAATPAPTVVEIRTPDATHRFERRGGRWRTPSTGADAGAVPTLLEALRTLTPLLWVDDASAAPAEFGLGPDAVRLITWSGESVVLDLDVGARNPAWTGVYVRRHGTQPIAMTGALLRWELAKVIGPIATGNALTKPDETREPSGSRPAKEAP